MRAVGLGKVVGFYGAVLAVALALLWRAGNLAIVLPAGPWTAWSLPLVAGGLACLALVTASRLATVRFAWARELRQAFRAQLGDLSRRDIAIMALLSGIAEEALFRGALQPLIGLVPSAVVFGAIHVGPDRRFWPWPWMAMGAGLIFGGLFSATGSLLAPLVAHAGVNYVNLRWIAARPAQVELHLGPVGGEGAVGS